MVIGEVGRRSVYVRGYVEVVHKRVEGFATILLQQVVVNHVKDRMLMKGVAICPLVLVKLHVRYRQT